jgi:hypothetical protein
MVDEPLRDRPAITPAMIEAGVAFCRSEFQWTDRRLSEIRDYDLNRLLAAIFGWSDLAAEGE